MIDIKFVQDAVCIREMTPDVVKITEKYATLSEDGQFIFEAWRFSLKVMQRDTRKVYGKVAAYDSISRIASCLNEETGNIEEVTNVLHCIRFRTEEDKLEIIDAEFDDEQWNVDYPSA